MHSNLYTFLYAAAISLITAVVLAFAAEGLKPRQIANIELDNKTSILRAVLYDSEDRNEILSAYGSRIQELVIDAAGNEVPNVSATAINMRKEVAKPVEQRQLPLYIYTGIDEKPLYIIPLYGKGLWGPIWGYISLENDFNTVYGAYFSHKSETPGLGAEISEQPFQDQFRGKKIMASDQSFISVNVVKKSAKTPFGEEHRVDGISGGTITSDGTDAMLEKGIEPYLVYFNKLKAL